MGGTGEIALWPEVPKWVVDFGDSGYVARYRLDVHAITMLAVQNQSKTCV